MNILTLEVKMLGVWTLPTRVGDKENLLKPPNRGSYWLQHDVQSPDKCILDSVPFLAQEGVEWSQSLYI